MKQLLNTLYITTPESYLASDGEDVEVIVDKKCVGKLPLQNFSSIITFGYSGASPSLMQKCLEKGIQISFMAPNGRLKGRVVGKPTGNVYLRKKQFEVSLSESESLKIAKNFILGKVYNQRWMIERCIRDHPLSVDQVTLKKASTDLKSGLESIRNAKTIDNLRGIEGNLATIYFSVFDNLIINQKEDFYFRNRNRRPPTDFVNTLLSFGYSLLANDCAAALTANGLDSYVGFMHTDRPGRESLALDLMEELRGTMVDRFVLRLINLKMIKPKDLIQEPNGACILRDESRNKFLSYWQKSKKNEIIHPYLKEKMQWGLIPLIQAQLLARYLREDMDEYPPFFWK
ncbi:subtype I-C CRISPR-associated endonuclease Cas1 [Lactobacillus johnsonii]|uniref:CRISPR-associated endonuclease Cas1 n=1 Tax=Lactobacillus johnsonii TaxID=33959 RepID=A0A267M417_LACJH|nr:MULTISPECIES: type I-C CRISPR-associated endonuclease Cas1c [Bacilli]PAB54381.1 subtype I-C CRISPR-associated endonuclease Cas1 [Lactobacillus johnsonii]HJG67052.1 type I-C CRISPR-associated endonuclease Cas1c [Staphylococcus ureilyticus]